MDVKLRMRHFFMEHSILRLHRASKWPKMAKYEILGSYWAPWAARIFDQWMKVIHYMFYIHEISYQNDLAGLKPIITAENLFFFIFQQFFHIFPAKIHTN